MIPMTWDFEAMYQKLFTIFPVPVDITPETMAEFESLDDLEDAVVEAAQDAYDAKTAELGEELMHFAEKRSCSTRLTACGGAT